MTKEELIKQIPITFVENSIAYFRIDHVVDFLSKNVCIPKGANRHPDVIHLEVEGIIELQQFCNGTWNSVNYAPHRGRKYRIKPPEPIYEWQWMINNQVEFIEYKTEDEISEYFNGTDDFDRIIKTKRVRQ